jgi:hypothetical protein
MADATYCHSENADAMVERSIVAMRQRLVAQPAGKYCDAFHGARRALLPRDCGMQHARFAEIWTCALYIPSCLYGQTNKTKEQLHATVWSVRRDC